MLVNEALLEKLPLQISHLKMILMNFQRTTEITNLTFELMSWYFLVKSCGHKHFSLYRESFHLSPVLSVCLFDVILKFTWSFGFFMTKIVRPKIHKLYILKSHIICNGKVHI